MADASFDLTAAHTGHNARSRIIGAAADLLRDGGAAAVTTRAVAHAAGVPAPTIFRIFGDKDGLMDAVAEHVMASYAAAKTDHASREDHDPVDDLRTAWRAHLDFALANPDLYVLLATPGRLDRSPATTTGATVLQARVDRLAAAGLLRVPPTQAVAMIHAAGTGAVYALLHQPPTSRDTTLADRMLDAVLHAVLTATPAPPTSDLLPLAITMRSAAPELPALTDPERALLAEWLTRSITSASLR